MAAYSPLELGSNCFRHRLPIMRQRSASTHYGHDLLVAFVGGHIVDVRAGGLVLDRHHNEDDIPMYLPVAEGLLEICGVMQGGEYVVNKEPTEKYVAAFKKSTPTKGTMSTCRSHR